MSFLACKIGFMSCVKIIGSNRHDTTARRLDTPQNHRMQLQRFIVLANRVIVTLAQTNFVIKPI